MTPPQLRCLEIVSAAMDEDAHVSVDNPYLDPHRLFRLGIGQIRAQCSVRMHHGVVLARTLALTLICEDAVLEIELSCPEGCQTLWGLMQELRRDVHA